MMMKMVDVKIERHNRLCGNDFVWVRSQGCEANGYTQSRKCIKSKARALFNHEGGSIAHTVRLWDHRGSTLSGLGILANDLEGWGGEHAAVLGSDRTGFCKCNSSQALRSNYPTDDIPTQQSKTSDTAKIIEDAIATGRLKTAGLKRRCKSERIAKRAKAFQFGKDGAGSCSEKAWDVDDVLAEK
ncbi:hypothetical protein Tco_1156595 [Tanacetum coccineum]